MNRRGAFHGGRDQSKRRTWEDDEAAVEIKRKIIPSSARGDRLREELLKIVPWEEITDSLHDFPEALDEHTKSLLMECMGSYLKHRELRKYRGRMESSSERILLQSNLGTGLYRERLVNALARELQVPLLKLGRDQGYEVEQHNNKEDDHRAFKKGDRVRYVGSRDISIKEVNNRILSYGQQGEVYEANDERVAVVFNICGLKKAKEEERDDMKSTETFRQALVTWVDAKDVSHDNDAQTHDFYIAMEVLYGALESQQPAIVYFPDSFLWPVLDYDDEVPGKVKNIFNQWLEGPVLICAENNCEAGLEYMNECPESLKKIIVSSKEAWRYRKPGMKKLFTNVVSIKLPKDEDLLKAFIEQIKEDWLTVIQEGNLRTMNKVLKDHNFLCVNLEHLIVEDMILTRKDVEKIVGWATNHYLSSCPLPCIKEDKLHIPYESIKLAILRLKEEGTQLKKETPPYKQSKSIKDLARTYDERKLVPAVVGSKSIGVKFDDVGGLEHVKKVLYETVILPMRRPELFSHGNLLRPCNGILLFGPPGTGKTLVAKALATESGANFINVPTATLTSMLWFRNSFDLTSALFSYASKLAPVIIFVDEVDSLLGACGHCKYNASRLNNFMEAWDSLKSKESQQILVIGSTNRPFDLDEAALRRMPRRFYVGLPDVENRSKILEVLLKEENLEPGFSFEQLAQATEDYSGRDLKNLCVAAAYRPIEELLEQESKDEASDEIPYDEEVPAPALRPLNLNDFIHSKAKVRASVDKSSIMNLRAWNEQYGEREGQTQQNKVLKLVVG